jgi:hypothetical protein
MAVPSEVHHEHFVDRGDTGAGIWAIVAVVVLLLALLFFGSRAFNGSNGTTGGSDTNVDIRGDIDTGGSGPGYTAPSTNAQ